MSKQWDIEWGNPIRISGVAEVPQRLDGKHTEYAHLIAAAPDLLAFAQSLIDDYCSDDGMASAKHIVKLAQEVVAKATVGEA